MFNFGQLGSDRIRPVFAALGACFKKYVLAFDPRINDRDQLWRFFLAWAIGNFVVTAAFIDENKYKKHIKDGAFAIYRANQIGTVLLFAGIILGGIWADYSWGRFWGWDPKETWALIAFLGYVAVLHGRIAGWIKDFGMAATSVVAFSLVIMAWYGVNYVLGAGLHSYGFGAGGVEYVASFVGVQLLYIAFVAKVRQSRLNENAKPN
ncbi:MAG: cytochrome c biogenesis protein CcsA [Bdellovibrionales bacterium]